MFEEELEELSSSGLFFQISKSSMILIALNVLFSLRLLVVKELEELRPRMWKNIQDKRRLLKMCTEQTVKWEREKRTEDRVR